MSGLDSESLLDELESSNVLAIDKTDSTINLAPEFRSAVEDLEGELTGADVGELDSRYPFIEESWLTQRLGPLATDDEMFAAILHELSPVLRNKSALEQLGILRAVTELRYTTVSTGGCPASFLPVRGDKLSTLTILAGKAIVYVWRDECEPCDVMKGELDEIFGDCESPLGLYAVYGPDWPERLKDDYAIGGGPTTLFVDGERVDSRLIGAHTKGVIEHEIQELTAEEN